MIELGEAESDTKVVAEAEEALRKLKTEVARAELEALSVGRGRRQRHLSRSTCRRRRHREPGLGEHAACACTRAGPRSIASRSSTWRKRPGEEAGIKSATIQVKGKNAFGWLKTEGGRASPGAHLAVRLQRAPPYVVRQRQRLSGGRRPHQHRDQRSRRARRHVALRRGGRTARQQDRVGRAPHPHPDQHRRAVPERPLAAPQPRPGLGHAARQAVRARSSRSARRRRPPSRPPRPTSAGATRSGPTCCSPTRW